MSSAESIINTDKFSDWIGLQTKASIQCLNKQVDEWNSDPKKLSSLSNRFKRFKEAFKQDPAFYAECNAIFKEISENEENRKDLNEDNLDLVSGIAYESHFKQCFINIEKSAQLYLDFWELLLSTNISPDVEITDIDKIIGTRNKLIHGYDDISHEEVNAIVRKNLPELKRELKKLL